MAFGNATKGYVKAHAGGGGGGGTADYEALLNKPSINGVELLGDKSIGSLSGNIQVKLSDIANTNLNNVQNAQTLLYNALSRKWENGTPASGSITIEDVTSNIASGVDVSGYSFIMFIAIMNQGGNTYTSSSIYPVSFLTGITQILSVSEATNTCYVTVGKSGDNFTFTQSGGNLAVNKVFLIK